VPKRMTARERFHETYKYGSPDRTYLHPQWFFGATIARWHEEGLPKDVNHIDYFDYDQTMWVRINKDILPPAPLKTIETGDGWEIVEDEFGGRIKRQNLEHGTNQWLRYMVRDREGWEKLKARLDPKAPGRYPDEDEWEQRKKEWRERDRPLGIEAGSLFGMLRDWIGLETLSVWYYDEPELVHEMTEYMADYAISLIDRALCEVPDIDFALIWEDMAMKTGSMISPRFFREFMMTPLKRITKVLREYGIDVITVDCDGNVDELIPLWLEADVNLVSPMEVAAGCDVVKYREQWGKDLLMFGGIDKRVLRDGCSKREIEDEVAKRVPQLVAEGGYSPFVDHAVPQDVPYDNFMHYLNLVKDICESPR
jgi:hypothetical protein